MAARNLTTSLIPEMPSEMRMPFLCSPVQLQNPHQIRHGYRVRSPTPFQPYQWRSQSSSDILHASLDGNMSLPWIIHGLQPFELYQPRARDPCTSWLCSAASCHLSKLSIKDFHARRLSSFLRAAQSSAPQRATAVFPTMAGPEAVAVGR